MADDRSPMDGWFRDEPDEAAGRIPPQAGHYQIPGQPPMAPRPSSSPDDIPTQVGAIPAIAPQAPQPRMQPPQQGRPEQRGAMYGGGQDPVAARSAFPAQQAFPAQAFQGQQSFAAAPAFRDQAPYAPRPSIPDPDPEPDPDYSYPEYQPHPHDRRSPARRKQFVAGGAVAGVAALGLVAYLALSGGSGSKGGTSAGAAAAPSPTHTSFQPTSNDPATAAEQTATAFLNAWQSGDLQEAAKYTDDPNDALTALTAYKSSLNLSGLTLKPQPAVVAASPSSSAAPNVAGASGSGGGSAPSAAGSGSSAPASSGAAATGPSGTVAFSATATVSMTGQNGAMPWTYSSSLVAYKQSDGWSVRWSPAIIAPGLADGQKLAVVPVPPGVGKVVDSAGTKLSSYPDAALQTIAGTLGKKAPKGSGTAGVAIQVTNASGTAVGTTPLATLQKPVDASVLKTTIDPSVQSVARAAVGMFPRSSMVVLRASTGSILAVANSAGSGDTALTGGLAPGSTFKTVTSAALLNHGVVSLYSPVACPLTFTVQGVVYHNASDGTGKNEESLPPGTPFITDFAQSCNNAFTQFYKQLEGGKLAGTASAYFGLNEAWDIGLGPTSYFSMPGGSSGAELAQEDFGQGRIVASPLAMASVAATAGTGSFNQPYLVSGVTKVTATALPSGTHSSLKAMMHAVVLNGTAAGVFSGVAGPLYAKTGTAETEANKDGKTNAWLIVYDPQLDVAIGTVVQDSGFGASYAGPEEQYVLSHL